MEKRIRLVWILSLVSIFLLVIVQAYWLSSQYRFVLDEYCRELSDRMIKAGNDEYNLRKNEKKPDYSFVINSSTEYTEIQNSKYDNQKLSFAFVYDDSLQADLPGKEKLMDILTTIDSRGGTEKLNQRLGQDSLKYLRLSINQKLPLDSIQLLVNMAVTNINNPFRPDRLDSLLRVNLPDHRFTLSHWPENDTIYRTSWEQTGSVVKPVLKMYYAYSPFQKEGITIETAIPAQPVFARMAVQLLLSFGILSLLIVCLIFQIRTILKQKKINELRRSFVNTMIHELKRPVQTLKTFIAFLGDKDMRTDEVITEQVVQDSMFELDNLSAYLSKLRDMVRADTEETILNLQRFDLRELTDKVIRLIQITADKKVEFTRYFDMESTLIEADPIHLANVMSNLIENAIKYSGTDVQIEIKARRKGNELCLTITDNGIGIPIVEQERVFAKFYRGSNIPDANIPGLGLGLSYVKLISEAHQGHVSLQSHLGEGTSVTLILPQ